MEVRPFLTISFMFGVSNFKTFQTIHHVPKCIGVVPRSLDVGDAPASVCSFEATFALKTKKMNPFSITSQTPS
jgi:hypothetical protein